MKRAKFEPLEKQGDFFIKVKKKLGIGSEKLSKKLGLKSRGPIESYTFMRTAPPINIIKKLEKLSGIKANYKTIKGKVYRKKREFIPLNPEEAEEILKKKFKKDFNYLIKIIKTNLTIKEILDKIRQKRHTFDNSKISRCVGSYRTNLLSKIVQDIIINKKEIIVKGHIRQDKKTLSINFNLMPLYNILKQSGKKVGLEISKDRGKIRLFPLEYGRKLIPSNKAIKILLTEKSKLKIKSKVEVILNPTKFGFGLADSIYDDDARNLYKESLKEGFQLDNYRSTPANHKGDLSLFFKDKNVIIEITKANSYKNSYFKVGQCFIQKNTWPNSIQFLACKKQFLSQDSKSALKKIGVKSINTNFNKGWEKKIIREIKNGI